MKLDTPSTIAESIDRMRAAFAMAKINERDVKVTWDGAAGWCRLRCRLPGGKVIERLRREEPTDGDGDLRARRLMHEMSVWTRHAAKRVKAGTSFEDESCTEVARG